MFDFLGYGAQDQVTGTDWHTDGLRQGRMHSFTLLVGVALSPMTVPNTGNLCVWPGSHKKIHPLMRWPDGKTRRANGGYSDTGFVFVFFVFPPLLDIFIHSCVPFSLILFLLPLSPSPLSMSLFPLSLCVSLPRTPFLPVSLLPPLSLFVRASLGQGGSNSRRASSQSRSSRTHDGG